MSNNHSKIILNTLNGQVCENSHTPIWLMRQAGRYLPEYHTVRNKAGNFLNLCYNPKLATEVTMQPINRFGFDGSIVFSDILVIPDALGQKVDFVESVGPILENISTEDELNKLIPENFNNFIDKLNPVYETLDRLKNELPNETTLIGFAGAPFTISSYMVASGDKDKLNKTLQILKNNPEFSKKLFDILIKSISIHLINQIKAGAQTLQIFDSWAGFLEDEDYINYSINPITEIIKSVKSEYPKIPIITFKRGNDNNNNSEKFIKLFNTDCDCISIGGNIDINYIKDNLPKNKCIQGLLSSETLLTGKNLESEIIKILDNLKGTAHIFNLSEGINKETPIKNVETLIKIIREYK